MVSRVSGWMLGFLFCLPAAADELDFNRDVRPILSRHCFNCHGQDAEHREAGLRLDDRESAMSEAESGEIALVPGRPEESQLIQRITSDDDSLRMPPADHAERLTDADIATLFQWISDGAPYAQHWAFVPPQRPAVPHDLAVLSANPVDTFIQRRLAQANLTMNPRANRYALIRRLSLDLRGIPPQPDEVEAFVHDQAPDAYRRLVDRYLHDPAYGERWARLWLDLARYADSRGYGSDPLRMNMWRYRDWVIDAFNDNLPYDQFTVEQLAGDLLPDPTIQQRMATAFHRNTMTNVEGGTDDEEFRVAAVKDRIETTFQVWMGLTMQCANCHDHKYDPLSQEDYYRFYAIFNQTTDSDKADESPTIAAPTDWMTQEIDSIEQQIAAMQDRLSEARASVSQQGSNGPAQPMTGQFLRIELPGKSKILSLAEVEVFSGETNLARKGTASQSSVAHEGLASLAVDGNTDGHYFNAKSTTHTRTENNPWWEVDVGEMAAVDRVVVWNRTDGTVGSRLASFRIQLLNKARDVVWQETVAAAPNPNVEQKVRALTEAEKTVTQLERQLTKLEKSRPEVPTLPVMMELPADQRRQTHIMVRGNFLAPSEPVQAGLPSSWRSEFDTNDQPTRLDAAQWLTHSSNPLTGRVAANRVWGQLFGVGLVETEEDFGTQGEIPSHPDLLDWLATEYERLGWDTKRFLRVIVTSDTYCQDVTVSTAAYQIDPRNRLLSRGPRFRMEAETLRDQALALSGLLSHKMRGPSVYPYQPPGLWRAAFNGERTWPVSAGDDKYRRGLYTFWRRTVPYPSMQTFDAPSREICTVRRIRTNTPLQAFVTLNDPVYVEAAQALARRLVREGGDSIESRVRYGLRLCLARPPQERQVEQLVKLFASEQQHFQSHAEEARQFATDPLGPIDVDAEPAELAAWTVVANVLLNLDGVLTKG